MTQINDALAFLLELAALAALAVWGDHTDGVVLAIAAPVAAAIFWGAFVAPKAAVRIPAAGQHVLASVVLIVAGAALVAAGSTALGVALAVAGVANRAVVVWTSR
ncbi:MAG TPA: DUF2568 domain-containing protein [Solirubrobacteraceae bacterium]|nr:DUF2568 domain-containing protein [Solirubrobacteraceae bacterium]